MSQKKAGLPLIRFSDDNSRLFWMLGLAMTVPFILFAGPVAGYVLAQYLFVKFLKWPGSTVPILTLLGFAASGLQVYRLIMKMKSLETKKNGKS